MQTFMPYPDFVQSVSCLDYRRLGKQRVEAWQIFFALPEHTSSAWRNHPAVKMWRGYAPALLVYGLHCCLQWRVRGYVDNMGSRFHNMLGDLLEVEPKDIDHSAIVMPPWLGRPDFHAAHRSNLLRKDPEWYGQFGWSEKPTLEYVWPVA